MYSNIEAMLRNAKKKDIPVTTNERVDAILENLGAGMDIKSRTPNSGSFRLARKFSPAVLAVAALVICFTTVTALAVGFGWHEKLVEYLKLSEKQQQEMAGNVSTPSVTVTKNGVTVTVRQAVVDAIGIYVLYDVIAPEWVNFENKDLDGPHFQENGLTLNLEGGGRWTGDWREKTVEENGNKRTSIIYSTTGGKIKNQSDLTLHLKDLVYLENANPDGGEGSTITHILVEGEWDLTWTANYSDVSKKIDVNKKLDLNGSNDNTIRGISLSPTSVMVEIEGDDLWTWFRMKIRMKNGEEIAVADPQDRDNWYTWHNLDPDNEMGRFNEDGSVRRYGVYRFYERFDSLMDMADVESVVIGGVTVPISSFETF